MMRNILWAQIKEDAKLRKLIMVKMVASTLILICKYLVLVELFDYTLKMVESAASYGDFLIIVLLYFFCVLARVGLQNTERQYINPTLKLYADGCFVGRLLALQQVEAVSADVEARKQREFSVNFVRTNIVNVINSIGVIAANTTIFFLNAVYLLRFHPLFLMVVVFPVLNIYIDGKMAAIDISINENESGILQTKRELVKITNSSDTLNYVREFSLFKQFSEYRRELYAKCIAATNRRRNYTALLHGLSSLLRIAAVFFLAVFIAVELAEKGKIAITDIVIIITACNMIAGSVSAVVLNVAKNKRLMLKINSIYEKSEKIQPEMLLEEIEKIQICNVEYMYPNGDKRLNYQLEIKRGNKLVLTGSNGCGKSTLLRILLGYLVPNSGDMFVNGRRMKGSYRLEKAVSVFEPYPVLNGTMRQFLENCSDNGKLSTEETQIIEHLGVRKEMLLNYGRSLSSGTKQAINLLRIIHSNSSLIVLDEPTSKLNKKLGIYLMEKILEKDATVVVATHDEDIINLFHHENRMCLNAQREGR